MSIVEAVLYGSHHGFEEVVEQYDLQLYISLVADGRILDADDMIITEYGL